MAVEILDLLLECGAVKERTNAGKRWLGCDLEGVRTARAAASKLASGWKTSIAWMLGGSRLDQIFLRKSSGTSGTRLLRSLRDCDGIRSPISSSVRSWRIL
jgi:hypothetical protein